MIYLMRILLSSVTASRLASLSAVVIGITLGGVSTYAMAQKPSKEPPPLLLGAAWYPEQWPESRWNSDLDLMQKAHMHVVRVSEFAWTALEPQEGKYELDWLERAVNLAGQHGIYVIVGTPSAGPPVWMATKYPDIMMTDANGKQFTGATRNRYNWNSDRYRRFVRDMDERLSKRFGHNPYVIGWQIDNEYNSQSYDPVTQAQFHAWLEHRYGTIDKLNQAWTTAYNNQTYSAFNEVPLVNGTGNNSPGLWLDSKRFISDSLRDYQKVQIDAIRKYAGLSQKITTNMMGWFDLYDHYTIAQDLDIIGWDNPQVHGSFDPIKSGAPHDLMRGLKGANYWVLETTAGPRGGGNASVQLDKGEMRAAIWADVGHGADLVSYWQWRDALNGGEANHGAIVDVDGEPDPIYAEYSQIGSEFEKVGPAIEGTSPDSSVAILHSYPSRWDIDWQKMNPSYDAIDNLMSYYTPLHELGYTIDIVPPDRDLSRYKLVIAPGLEVLTQSEADNLTRYVKGGGHLVLGQRSAMKDESNSRWPQRQPGPLTSLLGARVEQFTALDKPVAISGIWGDAKGELFAEQLTPQAGDVEVIMRYHAPYSWLDGQPAAVSRKIGNGSFTYVGACLDELSAKRAVQWMLTESGLKPDIFAVPGGVEVYRRVAAGRKVFIVDNLSHAVQTIVLPDVMKDALSDQMVHSVKLPVYGVAVLVQAKGNTPQ
jgi:beta-galactosidase